MNDSLPGYVFAFVIMALAIYGLIQLVLSVGC